MIKKKTVLTGVIAVCLITVTAVFLWGCGRNTTPKELPKPEITGGSRGEMGIDKNINEATLDDYLGRDDVVYRDMRMLEDPAEYENIGGDRFLSGYVKGFEIVSLPYIIPVEGLPSEVGETYQGDTLFGYNDDYVMVPNYEESLSILEEIFPKDKAIFLMCGGGGYAGMTKDFLISMGWDPEKIYNVGGYWYYNGKHNVQVKKEVNGQTTYDFDNVPYHNIDFSKLTPASKTSDPYKKVTGIVISAEKLKVEEDTSFKLKGIVVPVDAGNKIVNWTSSDNSTVYVNWDGLVRGLKPGTATVTAETDDGKLTAACEVTVTERIVGERIHLSAAAEEAASFKQNDPEAILSEFYKIDEDLEKAAEEGYYIFDGEGYAATEKWQEEYDKYQEKANKVIAARTEILNKLVDDKKSFVILLYTSDCEEREYTLTEGAERILKDAGLPYFFTAAGYDTSAYDSKLNANNYNGASVVIYKEGEIFAAADPNAEAIKSDEEMRNWLEKYIYLDLQ